MNRDMERKPQTSAGRRLSDVVTGALRVVLATPLLAYVIASVWGVNEDARRDARWADTLAQAAVVSSAAEPALAGLKDGQLIIVHGLLSGTPAVDPGTGAELQAARVRRDVRIRETVRTGDASRPGSSRRIGSTTQLRWSRLKQERWPGPLLQSTVENPETLRLGPFELPSNTLRAPDLSRIGDQLWLAGSNGFEAVNRSGLPAGRIAVFYSGIPYNTPATLVGQVLSGTLTEPDDGRQPLLFAPETLSAPEVAAHYRQHYANRPLQYGWLYSIALWPVLALLLPLICRLPSLKHTAMAQRTLRLFPPLRWALALPGAVLLFQLLVLLDRFVPR